MRIEKLIAKYDLAVTWVQFPLHPDTPPEGRSLSELFAGREAVLADMKARMQALMAAEGLPYADRSMTFNSRLAQELAKWAEGQANGAAIHDALFAAYFVDGRNLADVETLLDVARRAGLDVAAARRTLETRSFRDAVDADWRRSRELGVTGVPTFVAGGRGVVGAQPYRTLEDLVARAGAAVRSERTD